MRPSRLAYALKARVRHFLKPCQPHVWGFLTSIEQTVENLISLADVNSMDAYTPT